jgi:cytochrome c peroxidase
MNMGRIALGKSLFYDSIFSLTVKRTCAGCHNPSKYFTDGLKVPAGINSSVKLKRNTPTLLGAAFQTKFFYDSRASTLENQLNSVVHNVDEMNGSLRESIERIQEHKTYNDAFKKEYPNDKQPVTEYNIANAISSYVRSLSTFNTRFDLYMRGKAKLSSNEKKGFNLFAGKAKCATCHYIPLFNGLVPPQFTETESEVLGVPATTDKNSPVDDDLGKYIFTRSEIHKHAFKTPTLRNITLTAPYMHNGVFSTLEEVMDFYNKGGGAGLNIHLDNQTLPADSLNLSKKEIKSIIAFLGTLND